MVKAIKLGNNFALNETLFYKVRPVLNSMKSIDSSADYYMLIGESVVLFVETHLEEEQEIREWIKGLQKT